jgi:hypothetical protein
MGRKKMNQNEIKRPSIFLWLVARFTIVTFPLAVLLQSIIVGFGITQDAVTFIVCAFIAFTITNWYKSLDEEVTDYIRKKYP